LWWVRLAAAAGRRGGESEGKLEEGEVRVILGPGEGWVGIVGEAGREGEDRGGLNFIFVFEGFA
jgi:hypothetical protein